MKASENLVNILNKDISTNEVHYPSKNDYDGIRKYYQENGYVVIRDVIAKEDCNNLILEFYRSIKKSKQYFYRQTSSGLAEINIFNSNNLMINSILNIQDINRSKFGIFVNKSFDIFSNNILINIVSSIFSCKPVIVQSMYFEGNPATWAHQDTYYLDSSNPIGILAAWIALEDIDPNAGRFYIYPGSHLLDIQKNTGDINFSYNHEEYKKHIVEIINKNKLQIRIPQLNAGDILLWSSKTIHGSMSTVDSSKSRNSLTVHYLPTNSELIAFQSIKRKLRIHKFNNTEVHCPKPLNMLKYRILLEFEKKFPKSYVWLKRKVLKAFTR